MERSDGRGEIKMSKILRSKMSRFIAYILLLGMLSPSLSPLCAQEGADSPQSIVHSQQRTKDEKENKESEGVRKQSKLDELIEKLKGGVKEEKLPEEELKLPEKEGEEKPFVAILDLEPIDVEESMVKVLSDYLRTALAKTEKFTVVVREDMDVILKEQGFQLSGFCTQTECAVEIGQLLGAEKLFIGTLGKVGDTYSTTLKLFDVETGKMERSETELCKKCSKDELFISAENLARKMVGEPVIEIPKKKKKKKMTWLYILLAVGGGVAAAAGGGGGGEEAPPHVPPMPPD